MVSFLLAHFVGDFYFQNEELAHAKIESKKSLLRHSLVYQILMLVPFVIFGFNSWYLLIGILIGISHFLIDYGKVLLLKKTKVNKALLFVLDQVLHLAIICFIVNLYWYRPAEPLFEFGYVFLEKHTLFFKWLLLIIVNLKPANLTFKILYNNFKPAIDSTGEEFVKNAGAHIGNFERILYCICLALNQYVLIGFIITCKGFARHSYVQNKPNFAEYFLIGTFYSILYSIASFLVVFHLL
ncbi:MAG: DUF3307 domain-containing protein [Bacilli bacterium]|nr:DUF3307 domain-containing protein [Bacilli bacterium]